MMKRILAALLFAAAVLVSATCLAQTAADLTDNCTFFKAGSPLPKKKQTALIDRDYSTYCGVKPKKTLTVECTEKMAALEIRQFDHARRYEVQIRKDDEWQPAAMSDGHLTQWIELPEETQAVRLVNCDKQNVVFAELRAYGPGERPANIPVWTDLEKADLMLMVAHPDDDLLWFGGLLPTYAGERGLAVQVAYLVPTGGMRKLELLDALWHCGVTAYPAFLDMRDNRAPNMEAMYKRWGKTRVLRAVTGAIRRYRPDV